MPSPGASAALRGRKDYFPGASFGADFTRGRYKLGKRQARNPASLPGWTFTRASTGYAETAAGALVAFASGAPRITDKGLLVEEAGTNLALGSALTGGTLYPSNWSVGFNNGSARGPVASTTGAVGAWEQTALNQREFFQQTITLAANSTYTVSVYVEAVTGTTRTLSYCTSLPAGATTGSIFNPSTPGLYTYQVVTAGTAGTCVLRLGIDTSGDMNANATVRFSRIQFELGTFPTSYIPTTTASATRAADVAYISGLTVTSLHTLYSQITYGETTTPTCRHATLSDGTANERTYLGRASSGVIQGFTTAGGVTPTSSAPAGALTSGTYKSAVAVGSTTFICSRSGLIGSAVANAPPSGMSRLDIGGQPTGSTLLNGYVRTVILYPYAYTDAALQALTT